MKALLIAGLLVMGSASANPACLPGEVFDDCSGTQVGPGVCVPGCRLVDPAPSPKCRWETCEGPQVGPGPCVPGWVCPVKPPVTPPAPIGPPQLCLGASGCFPVLYRADGGFLIAESVLPNGYRVMGWAGPCGGPISSCPDIGNQAHSDLRMNALRIHRGLRFEGQVQ